MKVHDLPDDPIAEAPSAASLWNIANALTMLRLLLVPVFAVVLVHDDGHQTAWRIGAWAIFAVASVTDRLDGGSTGATSLAGDLARVVESIFMAVRSVVGGVLVADGEDEGRRCQAEALAHLALRGAEG